MTCTPTNSAPYTVAYNSDARVSYITGSRTGTTRNYYVLDVKDKSDAHILYVATKAPNQTRTVYLAFDYSGDDHDVSAIRVIDGASDKKDKCAFIPNQTAAKAAPQQGEDTREQRSVADAERLRQENLRLQGELAKQQAVAAGIQAQKSADYWAQKEAEAKLQAQAAEGEAIAETPQDLQGFNRQRAHEIGAKWNIAPELIDDYVAHCGWSTALTGNSPAGCREYIVGKTRRMDPFRNYNLDHAIDEIAREKNQEHSAQEAAAERMRALEAQIAQERAQAEAARREAARQAELAEMQQKAEQEQRNKAEEEQKKAEERRAALRADLAAKAPVELEDYEKRLDAENAVRVKSGALATSWFGKPFACAAPDAEKLVVEILDREMAKSFAQKGWDVFEPAEGRGVRIFAERRVSAKAADSGSDVLQCYMAFDVTGLYRTTWVVPVSDPPNVNINYTLSRNGDNLVAGIDGSSLMRMKQVIDEIMLAYIHTLDPVTVAAGQNALILRALNISKEACRNPNFCPN